MLRLVKTDFASAGKPDLDDRTPSGFLHVRTPHTFLPKCRNLGLQIGAHEIEFVPVILFGRMNRHFCRRQREDQPSVASVHRCKSKDVTKEGAISRRILAVYDDMPAKDHELCPFSAPLILPQVGRFLKPVPRLTPSGVRARIGTVLDGALEQISPFESDATGGNR